MLLVMVNVMESYCNDNFYISQNAIVIFIVMVIEW